MGRETFPAAIAGAGLALALGLLFYLRSRHPFVRIPLARVGLFLLWGACGAPILFILVAPALIGGRTAIDSIGTALRVGPLEEAVKMSWPILLLGLVRRWREEPFEWLLAGAATGTGFALAQNVLHFVFYREAFGDLVWRGLGPMHLIWSAAAGYCLGRRGRGPGAGLRAAAAGLLLAAILHGLWDALLYARQTLLVYALLGVQVGGFAWQIRKMVWLCAAASPARPDAAADFASAAGAPSPDVTCRACGVPYQTVLLRGVPFSSCPHCWRGMAGRGDLHRLVARYAGTEDWSEPDAWYRSAWHRREGEPTIQCPTCERPVEPRRFLSEEGQRIYFCDDCAMAVADRRDFLKLPSLYVEGLRRKFSVG